MKLLSTLLMSFISLFFLGGCSPTDEATQSQQPENESLVQEEGPLENLNRENNLFVEIEIEGHGFITVELYPDQAPISVENFVNLVNDGFYDGLTFHRIVDGFVMQGGDPLGNGTGGSDETIKGEFANNGIDNPLSHTRGAISMARSQDMDSARSQFFISHQDNTQLDGAYAVFGYVIEGMEIVDEICENTPVQDTNGTVAFENQPIITSILVID